MLHVALVLSDTGQHVAALRDDGAQRNALAQPLRQRRVRDSPDHGAVCAGACCVLRVAKGFETPQITEPYVPVRVRVARKRCELYFLVMREDCMCVVGGGDATCI